MNDLIRSLVQGDKRAAARLISLAESDNVKRTALARALKPHLGRAHLVGITGAPGSGKSTLINALTGALRKKGKKVGVLANDPTSPVSGGALLGDRIRMGDHFTDNGVVIRSMATREGSGGLSPAAPAAAAVLDAMGMDVVFIETTGVGQSETAIRHAVHTVVVVLTPNQGDDVQMMKAGVMEIGDLFVVNKGDLKDAQRTARDLESVLDSSRRTKKPSFVVTVASEGKGIDRLLQVIESRSGPLSHHDMKRKKSSPRRREGR